MSENQANACPVPDKSALPWAIPLPEANIINAHDIWKAVLDPETKNKGRMIAVLYAALSNQGMFGNNCPQEVRDKIKGMTL